MPGKSLADIDAIAIARPGPVGALFVGAPSLRALAVALDKPTIRCITRKAICCHRYCRPFRRPSRSWRCWFPAATPS